MYVDMDVRKLSTDNVFWAPWIENEYRNPSIEEVGQRPFL